MRKILSISIIILISLASCSRFVPRVYIDKQYPPIDDESPAIIYVDGQELPDSAEHIGDVTLDYNIHGLGGIGAENMIESIEEAIKEYGGNAVLLEDKNEDDRYEVLRGKIYRLKPFERYDLNMDSLKKHFEANKNDEFIGLYDLELSFLDKKYAGDFIEYACVKKDNGDYQLIYISGFGKLKKIFGFWDLRRIWRRGDVFATLNKTVNTNIFQTTYFTINKAPMEDGVYKFDNGYIKGHRKGGIKFFRKIFPDSAQYQEYKGSLTGFAINDNRILTCYHGIKDKEAKIFVKGINNDFNKKYEALVEKFDKVNDLAVIKLVDESVKLKTGAMIVNETEKMTGDQVYVLGYPLSLVMGEEIKLTNGIVSAQSGYAGDISAYQISAPVQPGNSGAPVLDNSGSLIGMVNSKLTNSDNVSYSIKIHHIEEFLKKNGYTSTFDNQVDISNLSLSEQIKSLKGSIYIIELINTDEKKKTEEERKQRRGRRKYDW